ncbi:hypothetical protein F5883DRAFT_678118 [Diaporthe sp. PMI_573]|nr:hypothetical protein F5883DRAFT_678118 [Diaporthaceae sp. PMI_573]
MEKPSVIACVRTHLSLVGTGVHTVVLSYPPQNPQMGQYPSPVSAAYQAPESYQLSPPAQVTAAFGGLSLTTTSRYEAGPSFNQPPTASQPEAAEPISDYYTRPSFPHARSNPYGQVGFNAFVDQPIGDDQYTAAEDWWVRMGVANDYDLATMVRDLEVHTEKSVQNYINVLQLRWTPAQDDRVLNVTKYSDMRKVEQELERVLNHTLGAAQMTRVLICHRPKPDQPVRVSPAQALGRNKIIVSLRRLRKIQAAMNQATKSNMVAIWVVKSKLTSNFYMTRNVVEDNWRLMSSAELPPCDGPKLQTFQHRFARIHWGDCIGGIGENGQGIGSQAYVFKVEIN